MGKKQKADAGLSDGLMEETNQWMREAVVAEAAVSDGRIGVP